MSSIKLSLFDNAINGTRVGTLDLADITRIRSVSTISSSNGNNAVHTVEIQVEGSVRSFVVSPVGLTMDEFLTLWRDEVEQQNPCGNTNPIPTPTAVSLQDAYDEGTTIDTNTADAAVTLSHTGSTGTHNVLELNKSPLTALPGAGISVTMGGNSLGPGLTVSNSGQGFGLFVEKTGSAGLDAARLGTNNTDNFRVLASGEVQITPSLNEGADIITEGTGQVRIIGGADAGGVVIAAATANLSAGADVTVEAGSTTDTASNGGSLSFTGGATSGMSGGDINITGGMGTVSTGGNLYLAGGPTSSTSWFAGNGGEVNIAGGANTDPAGSFGGPVTVTGGPTTNPMNRGGTVTIRGGPGATSDPSQQGRIRIGDITTGQISIGGGTFTIGAQPPPILITGHGSFASGVTGGEVTISAGDSQGSGPSPGGSLSLTGGDSVTGEGGEVNVRGGASNGTHAGHVNITGGRTLAAARDPGNVELDGGQGVSRVGEVRALSTTGKFFRVGSAANPRPQFLLEDGRITFLNASTATALDLASNPADTGPGNPVEKNTIYAKSAVKGWLRADGNSTIDGALGVQSIAANGANSAIVTWQNPATSAEANAYAVAASGTNGGNATFLTVGNHAVNACTVYAWEPAGGAVAAGSMGDWSIIRLAEQV